MSARAILLLTAILLSLAGCATAGIEADDIAEMWAFARAHQQYEREDSRDVRYVDDPETECAAVGLNVVTIRSAGFRVRGCTVMGERNYSILSGSPTAMEIAHEAAHRVYGDWHRGFMYFMSSELNWMRGMK